MKRLTHRKPQSRILVSKEQIIVHEIEDGELRRILRAQAPFSWVCCVACLSFLIGDRQTFFALLSGEDVARWDIFFSCAFTGALLCGAHSLCGKSEVWKFLKSLSKRKLKPLDKT